MNDNSKIFQSIPVLQFIKSNEYYCGLQFINTGYYIKDENDDIFKNLVFYTGSDYDSQKSLIYHTSVRRMYQLDNNGYSRDIDDNLCTCFSHYYYNVLNDKYRKIIEPYIGLIISIT